MRDSSGGMPIELLRNIQDVAQEPWGPKRETHLAEVLTASRVGYTSTSMAHVASSFQFSSLGGESRDLRYTVACGSLYI